MKRLLALTAAACLIAAPLSFAQTTPQPTPAPAQTETAPPPVTTPPPATTTPTPTPGPAAPTTPPATTAAAPDGTPQCRTRKEAGEQCSCLSAPTNFGTSAPAESGSHNMCVIPSSSSSGE